MRGGGDRVLTAVTLVPAGSVAVLAPLQNLVLPVHLVGKDSPGGFGVVVSLLAVGGITGAGLYAAIGTRWSRRTVFVAAQLTSTLGIAGLALLPPVPVMWAAAVLAGAGAARCPHSGASTPAAARPRPPTRIRRPPTRGRRPTARNRPSPARARKRGHPRDLTAGAVHLAPTPSVV
ncbi:hypothetical protein ACF1HJ_29740 [Streptomyces sp. NPDC013978]|uniref:hypothetical protein n=1 Tax=Streptomyces sp. NPDC013978 TaxID=3364869 RepID=UPI003700DD55